MKLHPTTVSQHELHQEIATALKAPTTLVYVDTNVLFWLFGLGAEPRAEFLRWANDEMGVRFSVPVWAAHELYGYLRSNQSALTPLKASLKELKAAIEQAKGLIAMAADDRQVRGFADLASYRGEIDRVGRDLVRLCNMTPATEWEVLAGEIIPFINQHILDSNIFPILRWIDQDIAARLEGRIPPGFADKSKSDNKFGDRMLWNEVVTHAIGKPAGAVVMLTNDNKEDWVYKPAGIHDAAGARQGNQREYETVLPSPLLLHELTKRTAMTDLHVVNVATFVVVMHRYAGAAVPNLFRAVQPLMAPTAEEIAARAPQRRAQRPPQGAAANDQAHGEAAPLPPLQELMTLPDAPNPTFTAMMADLASTDAFRQEAAVAALAEEADPPLRLAERFALGRTLREAALAGIQSAISLIADIGAGDTASASDLAMFAGVLSAVYLDATGARRRLPFGTGAETALAAAERTTLAPAVSLVVAGLQANAHRYLALPVPGARPNLAMTLELERPRGRSAILLGLRAGDRELLEDLEAGDGDTLTALIPQEGSDGFGRATVAKLRHAVAVRYSVPEDWLAFDEPETTRLKWPNTKGFRRL